MTEAGRRLLQEISGVGDPDRTDDILAIETEAVDAERARIRVVIRVSRDSMPIFSHVDAYGLGQVLLGKKWPDDR